MVMARAAQQLGGQMCSRAAGISQSYKKTELGPIPEDWCIARIGDVCRLINGRGFKPYEWKTRGLPIIRIQNINGSDEFNHYDGSYDRKLEVIPNQLLFAWSGSRGTSFGPHVWKGPFGLLNYHTWKVVTREDCIRPEFLFHALKHLTEYIESWAHGASALVHVQKWQMEGFLLPLPPTKKEQEAIAEALSDADALIESLEQLIAKKRQVKQGAMQVLLTGKRRLPEFTGEWAAKPIGDVLSIMHGKSQRDVVTEDGLYPILATGGQIGTASAYLHDQPSVLIGRKGTIDRPQYAEAPFWTVDTLFYSIMKDGNVAKYFYYRFLLIDWYAHNEASGVPSLNAKTIEKIEVAVPVPEEQVAIVRLLSDMDEEIEFLVSRLSKARQIKQGMMQELLTGRVRLV